MKLRTMGFLFLLALAISGSAFGQVDNKDYDIGGGGGGGECATCGGSYYANCVPLYNSMSAIYCDPEYGCGPVPGAYMLYGFSSCIAHQPEPGQQGPSYCALSGTCGVWQISSKANSADAEMQVQQIHAFLRQSRVISDADLDDFVAQTESSLGGDPYDIAATKRADAYRAEFNHVIAHDDARRSLKSGEMPSSPRKPVKVSITKTASSFR